MATPNVSVSTLALNNHFYYNEDTLLTYRIEYPYVISAEPMPSLKTINRFYYDKAHRFVLYLNQNFSMDSFCTYGKCQEEQVPFHQFEAAMTYTVTYLSDQILSLYTTQYIFAGGAHGSSTRTSETWNLETGQQMSLEAFYPDNLNYISDIKQYIIQDIQKQNAEDSGYYFDDYDQLVQKNFRPENFYLTPNNIAVYFQQYDIAPYAAGLPEFQLPYMDLTVNQSSIKNKTIIA